MNRAQTLAGATIAALTVLLAVAGGIQSPGPEAPQGHVISEATAPDGAWLVDFTALLDGSVLQLMGFDGGPPIYATGNICALELDGGIDPGNYGLPGAIVIYGEPTGAHCPNTQPVLELWLQGSPNAPFECACSSGTSCAWRPPTPFGGRGDLTTAPLGATLGSGVWVGSGCVRKPCTEMAGVSSWPSACPQQ